MSLSKWKEELGEAKELVDLELITEDDYAKIKLKIKNEIIELNSKKEKLLAAKELFQVNLFDNDDFGEIKDNALGRVSPQVSTTASNINKPPYPLPDASKGIQGSTIVGSSDISVQSSPVYSPPSDFFHKKGIVGTTQIDPSPLFDEQTSSPNTTTVGQLIGDYLVEQQIGQGGMGTIYLVTHKNTTFSAQTGKCVLKLIHPHLASDSNFRMRFIREAALGINLQIPNIVRVYSLIDTPQHLGFVMQYIEGDTLEDIIRQHKLPIETIFDILHPLAYALDILHSNGIVHRDLKPENIKVTPSGEPIILDFGIAMDQTENASNMRLTGHLASMGTPLYMPPEQMDAATVTAAADRYAFGLIAYEMFCGELPWSSTANASQILAFKLIGGLKPLIEKTDVSQSINSAVMKMISASATERFSSCNDFIEALTGKSQSSEEALSTYRQAVLQVLDDGLIEDWEREQLVVLREELGLSESEAQQVWDSFLPPDDLPISLIINEGALSEAFQAGGSGQLVIDVSNQSRYRYTSGSLYLQPNNTAPFQSTQLDPLPANQNVMARLNIDELTETELCLIFLLELKDWLGRKVFYRSIIVPISKSEQGYTHQWHLSLLKPIESGIWSISLYPITEMEHEDLRTTITVSPPKTQHSAQPSPLPSTENNTPKTYSPDFEFYTNFKTETVIGREMAIHGHLSAGLCSSIASFIKRFIKTQLKLNQPVTFSGFGTFYKGPSGCISFQGSQRFQNFTPKSKTHQYPRQNKNAGKQTAYWSSFARDQLGIVPQTLLTTGRIKGLSLRRQLAWTIHITLKISLDDAVTGIWMFEHCILKNLSSHQYFTWNTFGTFKMRQCPDRGRWDFQNGYIYESRFKLQFEAFDVSHLGN